jgi:putative ABC transport system substrate-binding protein
MRITLERHCGGKQSVRCVIHSVKVLRYFSALALVASLSLSSTNGSAADAADRIVRVGFVDPVSLTPRPNIDAFWARLRELGWEEGRNLVIETRSAEGNYDRLPAIMTELVDRKVDVLVTYSTVAGLAAKNATSTIPIVDGAMHDPVRDGLAASLARPGGNLTGLSFAWSEGFGGKLLELLQETVPRISTVAFVMNPDNSGERVMVKELASAAELRRLKLKVIPLRDAHSIQHSLEQARRQGQALLILGDPFLHSHRQEITSFANQNRFPALYGMRDFVEAGGMMAYGLNHIAAWRRTAEYVDKILRGANPGELPIEQHCSTRLPSTRGSPKRWAYRSRSRSCYALTR